MFPVLDRDLERMAPGVKISNDGRELPITIAVNHVAPVALLEQLGIKPQKLKDAKFGKVSGKIKKGPYLFQKVDV